LFGVQFDRQAHFFCGFEYSFGLRGRKSDAFAKGIYRYGQVLSGDLGHDFIADEVDVLIAFAFIFRRQGMGTQKSGHNRYRIFLAQCACHAQHADFSFQIQPVSGLYFHSGDPFGHKSD
jgi:hypothetical protein